MQENRDIKMANVSGKNVVKFKYLATTLVMETAFMKKLRAH
jgi:hypothetical protein